jgi:GT2 family glycosyltransferase
VKISLVIVNKDEAGLADTLDAIARPGTGPLDEVVVVDASEGRLEQIRIAHPWVEWRDYHQPSGVRITIPHQRNIGVRESTGDVVVFTDSGCIPGKDWLRYLLTPILEEGEAVTCGPAVSPESNVYSGSRWWGNTTDRYVSAGATINMAFRRDAFDAVGGFDEDFGAGEDLDFSWRLTEHGYRIRWVPDAVVEHQWGDLRRQLRRAFVYGVGWARLYRKHPNRLKNALREHPVAIVYPIFLLFLPLTLKYRAYPLLLLVPLWRNRHEDLPFRVLIDHLVQGAGVLAEVTGLYR